MEERIKNRVLKTLEPIPKLKKIMASKDSLQKKRVKVRALLNSLLIRTFDDNPALPSLKWVMTRDAILVFRNIISKRNEKLAQFSFLGYLNNLIRSNKKNSVPQPSPDFFAELEHLIRGISGRADVYPERAPAWPGEWKNSPSVIPAVWMTMPKDVDTITN
jgi:lysine 2,3-aminomutase